MRNYRNIVVPRPNFKYSINIQHDLFEAEKLRQYVPLEHSIKVFNELFSNIVDNKVIHSRILYGSYGTGKSHLVTVLATILGKGLQGEDQKSYELFCAAVDAVDYKLSERIRSFLKNSPPYLVVPVLSYGLGQGVQFEQVVYRSLIRALQREDLNFTFQDSFLEAQSIVENWMNPDKADARGRFQGFLDNQGISAEQLIVGLSNFDSASMDKFEGLFCEMTFGMAYQSQMRDLSQNLDETNLFLNEKGYRGIIFIFDEFGRYLEDYMDNFKIKSLQDLAEYCDHRGYDNHLLLISHQEILLYIRQNDPHKLEEWKKVEGRFRPVSMVPDSEQLLKIIQHVIPKQEPAWTAFQKDYQLDFQQITKDTTTLDVFSALLSEEEFYRGIVLGAFPLNPIVAFMLERLSKKIAQNERSIFTFLAGEGPFSLGSFLDSKPLKSFSLLTADWIYDYFASVLENQQRGPVYKEWSQFRSAQNKVDKYDPDFDLKRRILKSLVLINIIDDYESLKPSKAVIQALYERRENVARVLKELEQDKILIYMRQYGYYRFFDASNIDIDLLVNDTIKQQNGSNFYIDILNQEFIPVPVLPEAYNDNYKMTRYFLPRFALPGQLEELKNQMAEHYWDGLFILVLMDENKEEILPELTGERILYVLRDDSWNLVKEVKRYAAIRNILYKSSEIKDQDPLAVSELQAWLQESREYIENYVNEWARPASKELTWVYDGTICTEISSRMTLSNFLSDKLNESFYKTITVNNEMVNKNRLSGVMRGFRKEIVDKVLGSDNLDDTMGFRKLSGQHAFWRSVAVKNGIVPELYSDTVIQLPDDRINRGKIAQQVMKEIQVFLERGTQEKQEFYELYDCLKRPPYGLRDGYLAILLAIAMKPYCHNIFVDLQGQDQPIGADLLERMLEYPREFTISIDHWPAEKEKYITALEKGFSTYLDLNLIEGHRLMALHNAMLGYYRSVPRLGRSTNVLVTESTIKFRVLMENRVSDFRNFFFYSLPQALDSDYNKLAAQVILAVNDINSVVEKVNSRLQDTICHVFSLDAKYPINQQLTTKFKDNWQQKAEYSFHFLTNRFLDMLAELEQPVRENEFITRLAVLLTGFEVPYWGDRQIEEFEKALSVIKEQLEDFVPVEDSSLIIGENGQKKSLQLSGEPLTQNQEVLKRMLLKNIDDFAQALNFEQKQQVIVEVLRKYM